MAWPDIDTKIEDLVNEIKEIKTRHASGTGGVPEHQVWEQKDEVKELKGELRHDTKTRHPKMTLANPKETTIDKLPEEVDHGRFVRWVRQLYVHLDGFPEWAGVTALLKRVCQCHGRISPGELQRIAEKVDQDPANTFTPAM